MKTRLSTLVLTLLGSAFLSAPHVSTAPQPPVPGPGGVATTVLDFLERLDEGKDAVALLVERNGDSEFVLDADGGLQLAEQPCTAAFVDVSQTGHVISAMRAQTFDALDKKCAALRDDGCGDVRSEVRSLRCNCESERCSLAVVEFDRVYSEDGVERVRVPMRATALLQWVGGEGAAFRIYHWHASRAGEPRKQPTVR